MEAMAAAFALLQSNPAIIAQLMGGVTAKPAVKATKITTEPKKERKVTEVADGDRCRAIAYDGKTGFPAQCSKAKKENCRFCALHQKKAEESEEPCQYFEDGRKKGLFCGVIPDGEELDFTKVPFMSEDGKICIIWKGPAELVELQNEARKNGAAYHPFSNEGGGKKARVALRPEGAPVRVRKAKSETTVVPKAPTGRKAKDPAAPKRAKNAYFIFQETVRAEVAEEVKNDPACAEMTHPKRLGEIARRVKARWEALSDEEKKPILEAEAAEKKRFAEEKAAYVPSATAAVVVPAKRGRPAGSSTKAQVATAETAMLSALVAAASAAMAKPESKTEETEAGVEEAGAEADEEAGEEAGEEDETESLPFDPEAEVEEEAGEEEEAGFFTIEVNGKDAIVFTADQGEMKAGDVHVLVTDEDGENVPGDKIGTWEGDEATGKFKPLAKKPVIRKATVSK